MKRCESMAYFYSFSLCQMEYMSLHVLEHGFTYLCENQFSFVNISNLMYLFQIDKKQAPTAPPGLFFRHAGHRYLNPTYGILHTCDLSYAMVLYLLQFSGGRKILIFRGKVWQLIFILCRDKVVDFHWNASDSWTIVSVSDDGESTGGGGTLQVIRFALKLTYIRNQAILPYSHPWMLGLVWL